MIHDKFAHSRAAPCVPHRIQLFGGLSVHTDRGDTVTQFRTRKAGYLLAYLALHPHRKHSREELIDHFWADLPTDAARDNLSGCLSVLRRLFRNADDAAPVLVATRDTVGLDLAAVQTDVAQFERLLDAVDKTATVAECARVLQGAVSLYHGPLLNGMYEDWMLSEQARLAERFTLALIALSEAQRKLGAWETALSTARRAQQADPYNEASYQSCMRILAGMGRVEAARTVYQEFSDYLQRTMGCNPSAALTRLFETLDTIAASESPIKPFGSLLSVSNSAEVLSAPAAAFVVPFPLTRLWGRDTEMAHLTRLLAAPDGPRLITVTGTGGIGKTPFATAVAAQLLGPDSTVAKRWVSLAEATETRQVIPIIARVLRPATDEPGSDDWETINSALADTPARTLLVLDNAEHLLPRMDKAPDADAPSLLALVRMLLYRLPNLVLLVTSRRALGLYGEQEFPLPPLREESATMVFAERARLVRPDFDPSPHSDAVREIVRRVDGYPLALEMVAGWSRTLTPAQIAQRLASPTGETGGILKLLVSRAHDVPKRHRNIRETLLWSLDMLPPDVLPVFAALSVFHAGWTSEAAEAVVGFEALDALQHLSEHSLIIGATPLGKRLRFLEPIRELARELLTERGAEETNRLRLRHADYFADEAVELAQNTYDPVSLGRFHADAGNFRSAMEFLIQRAINLPDTVPVIAARLESYVRILFAGGGEREAWSLIHRILETIPGFPAASEANLLLSAVYCAWRLHRHAEVAPVLDRAEIAAMASGDRKLLARTRAIRANDAHAMGRHGDAVAIADTVLEEFGDLVAQDIRLDLWLYSNLGAFLIAAGEQNRAISVLKRVASRGRTNNDWDSVRISLVNLIFLQLGQGVVTELQEYAQEALQLTLEQGRRDEAISMLFQIAAIAVATEEYPRAARLTAAATALAEADAAMRGLPVSGYHVLENYPLRDPHWRSKIPPEEWQQYAAEGSFMTMEEAVVYAQDRDASLGPRAESACFD